MNDNTFFDNNFDIENQKEFNFETNLNILNVQSNP